MDWQFLKPQQSGAESSRVISLKPQNRSMWVKRDTFCCKCFEKKKIRYNVMECCCWALCHFNDSKVPIIWARAVFSLFPLRLNVTLKNSFHPLSGIKMLRPHGCCCFHKLLSAHFLMVAGRDAQQTQLPSIFTLTQLKRKTKTGAYWIKINPTGTLCNEKWNSQGNYLNLYAWPKFVACC